MMNDEKKFRHVFLRKLSPKHYLTSCGVNVHLSIVITTQQQWVNCRKKGHTTTKDLDRSWVSSSIKVHILGRKWLECSLCSTPREEQ